jgi:nitroreductase
MSKLDVRDFDSNKNVFPDLKLRILEAARFTGSGMNAQHWRFILVTRERLKTLADDSTTGKWVEGANFAVVVLTEEKYGFQLIDAGRAVQDMQIAAWNFGVVSCIFTGVDKNVFRKDFAVPENLVPSVVVGFGYPSKRVLGKIKNRKPLTELAYINSFAHRFEEQKLS